MPCVEEVKEGLALRYGVAVDEHGLLAAGARRAAENPMLTAMPVARVIGVRAIRRWRFAVVLFESRAHFARQFTPQAFERRENTLRISIFRLEVAADWRWQASGRTQNLAPILRFQPRVFIGPRDIMSQAPLRRFFGVRRRIFAGFNLTLRHCPFKHGGL